MLTQFLLPSLLQEMQLLRESNHQITQSLAAHSASLQAPDCSTRTQALVCDSPAVCVCSGELNIALINSDTHKHPLPAAEEQTGRTGKKFFPCNERSKCKEQPQKEIISHLCEAQHHSHLANLFQKLIWITHRGFVPTATAGNPP